MSKLTRNRNFCVVLYQESLEHMDMLDYLLRNNYLFQIVYILHEYDLYDEEDIEKINNRKAEGKYSHDIPNVGDLKKPHYHVLVHCNNAKSLKSFLEYFSVWIDYAEVVNDTDSYVQYMLHNTPKSLHKYHYDVSMLQGDCNLIRKYVQRTNFVQLTEVLDTLQDNGGRMVSLLRSASLSEREDLLEVLKKYQSLICTASNQEFRLFLDNHKR